MFGLDALTGGGALGMLPGANMLTLVTKGLELIKDLIDQGNNKGADAVLGFLNNVLNETAQKNTAGAAEPQPFTPPQLQSGGNGVPGLAIQFAPPTASPLTHDRLPEVDGSPAGDRRLSEAARPYVTGRADCVERALTPGSKEWTTVMWALQQNESIRYDANTSRFYTQLSDTTKVDVCSIDDLQTLVDQNGGYSRGNSSAWEAIGDFLKGKVEQAWKLPVTATVTFMISNAHRPPDAAPETGSIDEINSKIDELKRRIQEFEAARQLMAAGTNVTVTVGR